MSTRTPVTYACMRSTDGQTTTFGVFRAVLVEPQPASAGKSYVDLHRAHMVGRIVLRGGAMPGDRGQPTYLQMAEQYAVPSHPAYAFPSDPGRDDVLANLYGRAPLTEAAHADA